MSAAKHFVVIAEFKILPGKLDAFLVHAHLDAKSSLENEKGCIAFDVLTPENGAADLVVLHEVYVNRAAFEAHTKMPHYAPFREGVAPLLDGERTVRFFETR